MACKYCEEEWATIFNNRNYRGKKCNGYPGIMVLMDPVDSVMRVGACADTYEPGWVEAEFPINFCPMCGEKLREELIKEE